MRILIKIVALLMLLFSTFFLYDRYDMRAPVEFEALHQIDPLPHVQALVAAQKFEEAKDYLSFFMQYNYMKENLKAQALLAQIEKERESFKYKSRNILEGIFYGRSDALEGKISAGISDLFLLGDIRDLSIEGYHHYKHQEVDKTLVALSSIGVVASAFTWLSAGTTTPVKSSISFLKLAKRSDKLPSWLSRYLLKTAKEIKKNNNIEKIKDISKNIYDISRYAGLSGSLTLLKKTDGLKTLKNATMFSKQFGKYSATLVDILGKDGFKWFEKSQKSISKEAFMYASTYGKTGVKRITKMGEKAFLKSLVRPIKTSRLVKIFDKNSIKILNAIPDKVLWLIAVMAIMIVI